MTEFYLRQDLARSNGAQPAGPLQLIEWARAVADSAPAEAIYRNKEGRKTLRFEDGGRPYFLKLHLGVGWGEIFKNLFKLRLPVLGAENEYRAVNALQKAGVDTLSVAAYARLGRNPAALRSLIVTDDLTATTSLEDYCADWAMSPPEPMLKRRLIRKLADSARRMHDAGINHRDFYLCHFHLDESSLARAALRCHLIDLHRAQKRARVPRRWLVKDLAGLYFSAMDCGLSRRDLLRFVRHYSRGNLRQALVADAPLWRRVNATARRLYRKQHGAEPPAVGLRADA